MGAKLKYLLNVSVVLLIFAAFHPSKHTGADYGLSLIVLAIGLTLSEDYLYSRWRAKRNPAEDDSRSRQKDLWAMAVSLVVAVALALIVPNMHRNSQKQAEQDEVVDQKNREDAKACRRPQRTAGDERV